MPIASLLVRSLAALAFALTAASAAVAQPLAGQPSSDQSDGPAPSTGVASSAVQSDYKLGAGDKIRIIVFGEESLTGEFLVPGGAGQIAFPLIGDVQAGGLTVSEMQQEVEAKLKDGYLKLPHVSIEVLNYRPFYILGEVTKPGEYPYTNGLTVVNAVATANGFTYRADTHHVYIRRAHEARESEYPLTSSVIVAPGDTIRIRERFF
jgi:polysaccharide export outer membrane protein